MHRFLECFDFAKLPEFADWQEGRLYLQQQIKALTERGRMTEEEAGLLDFYGLYQFFCTGVARRMQKSAAQGLLSKEKPFVMSVLASRVWPEMHTDSTVLVQGIIDVFWEEEDGIVLLDYKTDRVERPDQLTARYERQLLLYREALERNFGAQRVKEILIYSFRLKQFVPVGSEK